MHIGSIPDISEASQQTLEDGEWYEGDVVVHNHPYYGASHTPDLAIAVPVFYQGRLVGFAANTAHHVDIGAATPGLIIDVHDVYAEGMLFAGTKLYTKGVPNRGMWNYIRNNSRAAQQLVSDIEAQVASARLGAQAVCRTPRQVRGIDRVRRRQPAHGLFGAADAAAIREIPDGDYRGHRFSRR